MYIYIYNVIVDVTIGVNGRPLRRELANERRIYPNESHSHIALKLSHFTFVIHYYD